MTIALLLGVGFFMLAAPAPPAHSTLEVVGIAAMHYAVYVFALGVAILGAVLFVGGVIHDELVKQRPPSAP